MAPVAASSRTGFRFKQFIVRHDQCAMKVCTDSCTFGAWFANRMDTGGKALDIGAGSGLLTLMLAQKSGAVFHAIEIDEPSFLQMEENVGQSPWKNRIRVFHGDVNNYALPGPYDFIICNPPFYEDDLKSDNKRINFAKHDAGLTLGKLTRIVNDQLTTSGSFGILLPYARTGEFEQLAASVGLFLQEKLLLRQTRRHGFFRCLLLFSRCSSTFVPTSELVIKEEDGNYSEAFSALLRPYYLHL